VIKRYQTLARRIRQELDDLERTQAAVVRHWQGFKETARDHDAFLNSVAFNLQGFYSGLERVFELIAVELDGGTLGGASWHTELLHQMSLDLSDVRPPVIHVDTVENLDKYRRFRHLVRNVYASVLDPAQVQPLVEGLPQCWNYARRALETFAGFLETVAAG
jgi:hypothetical protein